MSADLDALKAYVRAKDDVHYATVPRHAVALCVSHSNLKQVWPDIRCDRSWTVLELKNKLYTHGGTLPQHQRLFLTTRSRGACELTDDDRKLGYYSPENGDKLHIKDTNAFSLSRNGGLEDVSLVEKFELTDEEYMKREDNARKYKAKMQAADPTWTFGNAIAKRKAAIAKENKENAGAGSGELAIELRRDADLVVGARCAVLPGERRGTVRYLSDTSPQEQEDVSLLLTEATDEVALWVGVELDEPLGRNDGSVKGRVLFVCEPNRGVLVRQKNVVVGDYPEIDPFASDSEGSEL